MPFRNLRIKQKLVAVMVLTSLAVLGLTSVVLLTYELYSYKQTTRRTLFAMADIIAAKAGSP